MKKIIIAVMTLAILSALFTVTAYADKVYEFDLKEGDEKAKGALDELVESIPDEIKDSLPESREDFSEYDFEYFMEEIKDSIKEAVKPAVKTVSVLLGIVIIGAVFNIFSNTVAGESMKGIFSFCSSLCVALSIFGTMQTVFNTVEALLETLTTTMLAIIPTMEVIYIQGGNLTTAAVTSTGINLMIGFTETLFSKVLEPAVYTVFILSVVAAVTKNQGVSFMGRTLKGMLTASIIIVMTVMSFVLTMQTSATGAADTVAVRTIKFAIGNYLPIVGGSVADSFSLLSGSLGVIKQSCGIISIAVIIAAFLPPFCVILLNRVAVGLSGAAAGVLGCEREGALLEECKGICTLLLAVCTAAAVMYIIALGVFCKTPVAMN